MHFLQSKAMVRLVFSMFRSTFSYETLNVQWVSKKSSPLWKALASVVIINNHMGKKHWQIMPVSPCSFIFKQFCVTVSQNCDS